MKYFAHLCTAQDDDKHDLLFDRYKFEGYGVYWWLCENVGKRKKTANDSPEYLFNMGRGGVERGTSRKRIAEIIGFMHDIELIEADVRDKWIAVKIPKLNDYSAEWQKRLAKQDSGVTRETLGRDSVGTRERLGPEVVDVKILERKKRCKAQSRIETDGLDAPADTSPELEADRQRGLDAIKAMTAKIGGEGQSPTRRVVESQGQLPEVETPEDLTAETIEREQRLRDLGIAEGHVGPIINAWLGLKTERFDSYALATVLNSCGILGLDRSKVYQALGVA